MNKKTVKDVELNGKKVLVRVDFNVPMKDGKITNDNRIVAAFGRAILFSHLGKIKSEEDKASKSLRPAAERLAELLGQDVKFIPQTRGAELEAAIAELKDGEVLMFENTRFEDLDGKKESKNDAELGKYWASLGDVFVNDAFGTAHRAHASKLELAKALLEKGGDKLVLPIDTVAAKEFSNDTEFRVVSVDELADDEMGLDVGPATVELFSNVLKDAKTVVWNGPMGVFEMSNFAKGTIGVCEAIANLEGAITIIGGGDSAAAAMQLGYADKFSHISTGGGASLEYLEGKELPGVASLSNKCCGCGCK